ncbi:MAG: class I SAM-dependent methyltransferase [Cyanobacteria bacterium J06648_16]
MGIWQKVKSLMGATASSGVSSSGPEEPPKKISKSEQYVPKGISDQWVKNDSHLVARTYDSYEQYLSHQSSKLSKLDRTRLSEYESRYYSGLVKRLEELAILRRGDNVLCLAARTGIECKAFIDLGCFPIGIDLNPGPENYYVVHGDFHHLQFADSSVDYVFTNSLDHAFDLDKILSEVLRVLQPEGRFIAEIVAGSKDERPRRPGLYESVWWERSQDMVDRISSHQFEVEINREFNAPWTGRQVVFKKRQSNA